MNKAFVKDPEPGEPRCPAPKGCGGLGSPVSRVTLVSQLPEVLAGKFSESAYYCANPSCQVAYFDTWGTTAERSSLSAAAYPKSPTAPVCSCFGFTADEVRTAAEAGRKDIVRDMVLKAEGDDAQCETKAPSGSCCATEIRRLFLHHLRLE